MKNAIFEPPFGESNTTMANPIYRQECERLLHGQSKSDQIDSYRCIIDTAMKLTYDHHKVTFNSPMEHEAGYLLFQLTIQKSLSIIKLLDGADYQNNIDSNIKLNKHIDPFSIYPIVRTQYEAYCVFNNLFFGHIDPEQKEFLYDLWVLAGLTERQKYSELIASEEAQKKFLREKEERKKIYNKIESTKIFTNSTSDKQNEIEKAMGRGNFQFHFINEILQKASWSELFMKCGASKKFFDKEYSMLSISTHPSNVSVYQYRDMIQEGENVKMALFAAETSKKIVAFFTRDYCTLFPVLKLVFNGLPLVNQVILNLNNRFFRGNSFTLNNAEEVI